MAAIDFPNSPSNGTTHTANGITWVYSSTKGVWKASTFSDAPTGEKGQKGQKGQKGATGATGSKGQKGATGSTGAKGATGSTGSTGSKGQKGATGSVAASHITLTNYHIISASGTWSGDPGTSGKIQYHSNRWYIVSGSGSTEIVRFRRNNTNTSYIANDGTFNGRATSANWADLAERYEADAEYEEGVLLGIGGDKEVTLFKRGMPMAGVVSLKPGYRMNDAEVIKKNPELAATNPFICLKGRIPVNINGSAKKGDYIVADDNGKAKAVQHKINIDTMEFIGIALEDGEDVVEVKV